ncbi:MULTISPECIES: hypothetical protein [Ochrobactrum]|uniref:Uncharacterized protein n=1 Tax=Ochrobactrum quorumnocens TaxID=271865 RepID=A0A5N1K300_9HYPH|nr:MULTISPECIES: hypothetical protein [Brucella/Ochrobactrum group]KAA9368634.1 hypothetical protein F3W84_09810 [[Ochrobactrum] quorumnocens]MCV9909451.1 hypothetical protein [Brucella sp. HL-2]MDH7791137.1 uncharacterized membrane protein YhaH (DUF805 family) [Ochrobactrum sp. AN78]
MNSRVLDQALDIAGRLRRNAFFGIGIAVVILSSAPFLRSIHDLAFWLIWPLLFVSVLIVMGIATHLLFDAALFRLLASSTDEKQGLTELDTILARMGLRAKTETLRPLNDRIAGSKRILGRLRVFLAAAIVLTILMAVLPIGVEL